MWKLWSNAPANLKYELLEDDEVWFVFDTDNWGPVISEVREKISSKHNWFVAKSNPCFEVWLHCHFEDKKPFFEILKLPETGNDILINLLVDFIQRNIQFISKSD